MALFSFMVQVVVASLSGVMAPGPATAATLMAGLRNKHAGLMIALGHAVIEVPLMLLVMWGVRWMEAACFSATVGLVGGACLLYMGAGMLSAMRKPVESGRPAGSRGPFLTGIIVTGGNPYFLLWWPTVALNLCKEVAKLGPAMIALFALVHWLCDLVWMEALSISSYKGSKWLGPKSQKYILGICGAVMLYFGVKFIVKAALMVHSGLAA